MSVSIQQASANAFASYLAALLPTVTVEARWPAPDKRLPAKAISIVKAGRRRDTPIDLRLLSATNSGDSQTAAVWQTTACYQPFQLDVWAQSDLERDDILAQLDILLHAGESALAGVYWADPVGNGVLVAVQDGWEAYGTTADFMFEEPDIHDDSNSSVRSLYRASFKGGANFMLAIPSLTARQKIIQFKAKLDESADYDLLAEVT